MNQISLMGRVAQAPEVFYSKSQTVVARYCLAVPKIINGEKGVDFIQCVSFGKTAENIGFFVTKGQQISVNGRLDTGKYVNQEGVTRHYAKVIAPNVTFGAKPNQQQGFVGNNFPDEEIPF